VAAEEVINDSITLFIQYQTPFSDEAMMQFSDTAVLVKHLGTAAAHCFMARAVAWLDVPIFLSQVLID
jgi:hypothetical protein